MLRVDFYFVSCTLFICSKSGTFFVKLDLRIRSSNSFSWFFCALQQFDDVEDWTFCAPRQEFLRLVQFICQKQLNLAAHRKIVHKDFFWNVKKTTTTQNFGLMLSSDYFVQWHKNYCFSEFEQNCSLPSVFWSTRRHVENKGRKIGNCRFLHKNLTPASWQVDKILCWW
jgi:hypothetical protein